MRMEDLVVEGRDLEEGLGAPVQHLAQVVHLRVHFHLVRCRFKYTLYIYIYIYHYYSSSIIHYSLLRTYHALLMIQGRV